MVTPHENMLLTQTDSGTPMGDVLRRYWIPALISREIPEPDCPPARVKLLGEELVAFRDTDGRIGMLDEFCAHRRASLWLGRNEECGLRCVYHGWKYDVDGNCVDQMNEPQQFRDKVRLKSYPAVEEGGVIWAYMGPRELMPPPPKFDWTQAPATHRQVSKVIQDCNWLQALEGGIDTSHAQILHRYFTDTIGPTGPGGRGDAPKLEIDETDYGYRYVGIYPRDGDISFVRSYHYIMPFTQIRPSGLRDEDQRMGDLNPRVAGHIWVPMDDEHCMVWNWFYSLTEDPLSDEDRSELREGNGAAHVDQVTFRSKASASNNWTVDREAQRTKSFSGINGINTQDRAVQESMGPIVDRTREFLGPGDMAIVMARRMLLDSIRTVQDGGDPPGVGEAYYSARAMQDLVPNSTDWRDALLPEMYHASV